MKVLQRKMRILVISSILISALVVMTIAFFNHDRIIENSFGQIMQLMCSEKRQAIDEKLLNIEQSVQTIYHFAVGQMRDAENLWQDEEQFTEHITRMRELMETTAQYTDGAVSVYYRLNFDLQKQNLGVWLVQDKNGNFVAHELTDLSIYDKEDIEHVGWYHIPIANQKETWMNSYYNQNMGEEMISYVIPIILEDKVIGVVGMDIATQLLYENTKNVKMYQTGYAFLMDNEGKFVYHPEMKGTLTTETFNNQHAYLYEKSLQSTEKQSIEVYQWNGEDKYLTSQKLRNGMIFTVCVTEKEIMQPQNQMLMRSIVVTALIVSIFIIVTGRFVKAIVKLAYTDVLTGLGNSTAYRERTEAINRQIIDKEDIGFAIVVVDINDLKKVNDNYGHEYGDLLIQNAALLLKKIWGENAYRIGGDEFAMLLMGARQEEVQEAVLRFEEELEVFRKKNERIECQLQMAVGATLYNTETDREYTDVFRRADTAMYENKRQKKRQKG